ncbi:MAG: PAS domain S-box protein, partial [Syntrophobacteraceae bacterium]
DITERKLAEAALKDSETQFRTLVESAPDAIFILVEGRFFVYANDAAVRLYGAASEKELLGRDIMESIHPDHRASVLKRIRLIDEEEKPIPPMELRHVKLDGTTVYVESHAVPIKYRKSKAALVFVRDITERKKNEEALSISEERYKRLFEDASMGIFRVTLEGKLIDVNPAFTLMFGFDSPEEVKSQVNDVAVDLFVDPSRRHEIVRMMLDTKRPVHAESLYGRKDGSTFMADLHAWAVRDKEGKLLYLEGFVEDISERKRAEEEKKKLERQLRQSQKLEALGTLAGGIAHDFNNILQPIIGYIEIVLLALSPSSPQRENLERVFTAALRAKDLVKQILAISRSPEEQRRTPTDISSIVKEALKLLRSSLPTSIEMRQKILKGAALADPTQIHQVLMNLCTNAAHAMDGKGILEVRLSHVDLSANDLARRSIVDLKSGPYLKLTVSDTGCGMDAETLERIFDPYFTTKEVGKGSGLGLAVVDGIVKRHEGAVTVRSETGKGTTFTIYIPRVDVESEATMQFDDLPPLGSERILLVDDDAAVMETGASLLKSLGYKVTSQTDSMKTLEVFRSTPHEFDLLITDYTMPKLTG